jgi:hypothetical protein
MKKFNLILIPIFIFVLTGCKNQTLTDANTPEGREFCRYWINNTVSSYKTENDLLKEKITSLEANGLGDNGLELNIEGAEYKTYKNETYGYTIETPKTWGTISPIENSFRYDFDDKMGIIGPYMGSESDKFRNPIFIHYEKLNDGNPESYQSWFKDYKEHQGSKYSTYASDESVNNALTKEKGYPIEELEEHRKDNGEYVETHRFIRGAKAFLVFVYNKNNEMHKYVIDSIKIENQVKFNTEKDYSSIQGISTFYNTASGIEMERYKSTRGFTIEIPKTWGSIYFPSHPSKEFSDDLFDDMEAVGPLLLGHSNENWREYIGIEIFNDKNSARKPDKSWIDFYKGLRLDNSKYITDNALNESLTKQKGFNVSEFVIFDQLDKNETYLITYRVMENKNGLYAFSYNKDNEAYRKIIESITLD